MVGNVDFISRRAIALGEPGDLGKGFFEVSEDLGWADGGGLFSYYIEFRCGEGAG